MRAALAWLGVRYFITRPSRLPANGKAERPIRILLEEWAYVRLFPTNAARGHTSLAWFAAHSKQRPPPRW